MENNRTQIEQRSVNKVNDLISLTEHLVAYFNAHDKEPIWDGHIYAYSGSEHKVEQFIARFPVQIKGTTAAAKQDGGVSFKLDSADLHAYVNAKERPTVFFVVTMDERLRNRTVYYRVFNQKDTEGILEKIKKEDGEEQQTKTLDFSPLPTDADELDALFLALAKEPDVARPLPVVPDAVTDPFLYNAGTVDFLGRGAEIERLDAFLSAAGGFRWWGVAAAGGAGKTRLAYEWGRQAEERGWSVHWLRGGDYDALDQWSDPAAPTLLIADYAWQHAEALGKWMDALCENAPSSAVRVLLLERDAGEEYGEYPWEKQLYQAGNEAHLRKVRHEKMLRLPALDDDALQGLMRSFAASLQKREPDLPALNEGEDAALLKRLRVIDPDCRPLFVLLLTDAFLRGAGVPDSQEELLENLVIREKNQRLAAVCALTKDAALRRRLERLGGELRLVATALGADGDLSVSRLAALLPDTWEELGDCAERLGLLSPEALLLDVGLLRVAGGVLRVPALRPDLLGEFALLLALRDCRAVEQPRRDALCAAALGEGELLRRFVQRLLSDCGALLNRRSELWARLFPELPTLDLPRAAAYSALLYDAFYRCTDRERRLALLANMEQCAAGIREDAADAGTVYNHLGLLYRHSGAYDKALAFYDKALAIVETVLGREHPDTAATYNNLAVVYYAMGDFPKALEYYDKALTIRETVLGREHPDTATTCNNLAVVYQAMGDFPKALAFYDKALAIREKVLGREHPDTATTYNNLAVVYKAMGDFPKALEFCDKALAIREKVLGREHPDTAMTYNNLAVVYKAMGDFPKALEFCDKALAVVEKVLGREHPSTAATYNNLAAVYQAMGDFPKALEFCEKDRAISEKVLGREHPDTATTYNNLGAVYYAMGELPTALAYCQRALAIWEKTLGAEHPNTKIARSWVERIKQELSRQ